MPLRARMPVVDAAVVLTVALASGARAWAPVAALAAVLVLWSGGAHAPRLLPSTTADAPVLLVAAVATGALTSPAAGAAALLALLAVRVVTHARTRSARSRHPRRVLVVGTGPEARRVVAALVEHPEAGLRPVGFVGPLVRGLPLTWLGGLERVEDARAEVRADAVVSASAGWPGAAYVVGRGDLGLVPVAPPGPAGLRAARSVGGAVVALALLALLLVPATLLAVLVRAETGGVLVREAGGMRFRTRHVRSVARTGTTWSLAISGRTGPVGRVLTRTGLDRLPQAVRHLVTQVVGDRALRRSRRAPVVPQRPRAAATSRR